MTNDNFCFYLQNRLIQTNQTGGQWYNDTSPLVFPSITDTEHNNALHCAEFLLAECRVLFIVMLSVVMLNVIMLSAVAPSRWLMLCPGNTKGRSITVQLTSCLTGLD